MFHQRNVFEVLRPVVHIQRYISGLFFANRELCHADFIGVKIPVRFAFAIGLPPAFDLIGRCADAEQKAFRKMN